MKKLLCALLAGLMLLGTVACAQTDENPNEDSQSAESAAVGESTNETEAETEDPNFVCDLPDDISFGGKTVNMIYTDATGRSDELVAGEQGGVVSDAVHARNLKVQEQLNVKLAFIPKTDSTSVISAVKADISGDVGDFELVSNGTYLTVQPAIEGCFVNLSALENIDTSKHYWTQGYNDMVTFTDENMQFLASGSAAISMFRLTYLTIYNKDLFADNKIPDLYETVKAGQWTLDYQYSIATGRYMERGDGKDGPSEGDFFGFVTGDTISVDPYMVATDLHLLAKDPETRDLYFNGEDLQKLVEVCEKVQKLYNDQSTWVYKTADHDDVLKTDIISHFNNERALMATTLFLQMEINFNDLANLTYGIAPMPKYDEEQKEYYSYVQDQVTCFGISAVVKDPARRNQLAAILEAMAYHSHILVRPAYYDTALSERYMQDPQSSAVLDMIFKSLQFDFSSSCSNIFSSATRDSLRPLLSGKSNTIASATSGWERSYNRQIEKKIQPSIDKLKEMA